jgi:hypothetical protein
MLAKMPMTTHIEGTAPFMRKLPFIARSTALDCVLGLNVSNDLSIYIHQHLSSSSATQQPTESGFRNHKESI